MINSLGYGSRPQLLICFCSVSLLILRHANYGTYRINQLILSLFLVCPNKLLTIYSRCNSRGSVLVLKKKGSIPKLPLHVLPPLHSPTRRRTPPLPHCMREEDDAEPALSATGCRRPRPYCQDASCRPTVRDNTPTATTALPRTGHHRHYRTTCGRTMPPPPNCTREDDADAKAALPGTG